MDGQQLPSIPEEEEQGLHNLTVLYSRNADFSIY